MSKAWIEMGASPDKNKSIALYTYVTLLAIIPPYIKIQHTNMKKNIDFAAES